MQMRREVLLPRANDTLFLGALRSLNQLGSDVIPLTYQWDGSPKWHSSKSKFFNSETPVTNPHLSQEKYVSDILNTIAQKGIESPFYLPTSDTNLIPLYKNKKLVQNVSYFGDRSNFQLIDAFNNKGLLYAELLKLDIPTPKTCYLPNICQFTPNLLSPLSFPIIFKPAEKDTGQTFYSLAKRHKAVEIKCKNDVEKKLKPFQQYNGPLVFQEKVVFSSEDNELPLYMNVSTDGSIISSVCGVKHLINPPRFGTAAILGVCAPPKELLEIGELIVSHFNWFGPIMIEFIFNEKNENWEVIEINGRPWLMIDFFRRIGCNFLSTLKSDQHHDAKFVSDYADFVHIDLSLLFYAFRKKLDGFVLNNYLNELDKKVTFTHFDPKDPEPGLSEAHIISEWTGNSIKSLNKTIDKFGVN